MTPAHADGQSPRQPLRLWPGVVAVGLQWLSRFVVPLVFPEWMLYGVLSGLVGGLVVLVWWAFFSRVPRAERWGAIVAMIAALALTPRLLHPSVANGMMGLMFYLYAIPVLSLALVAWAVATRHLADGTRRVALVAVILLACGSWALVRSDGIGDAGTDFAWRWSSTPEERLLAQTGHEPEVALPPPAPELPPVEERPDEESSPLHPAAPEMVEEAPVEAVATWPGFRGPHRDGTLSGVRIATDWSETPPVELWRRPVGPGWSSFAVAGDLLYTQEQRGEEEVVSCYRVSTGEPVWRHGDGARFWEANAGAGPRATPTLSGGRVYSFGGTGILNALDAEDGSVVWSRDVASEAGAKVSYWGFSSSPLVTDGVVVVWAGALVAYDATSGDRRWSVPAGGENYSSPRLLTIDGTPQVVALSGEGATGVAPADGTVLWEHPWPGLPILEAALTADGGVLIAASESSGTRRLAVARGPDGWSAEERWTSIGLKPYFNDIVVHEGHAFGFDGRMLACVDVEDGERRWKGGRYGTGQLVLLTDQDLLLLMLERGELALVAADPDQFRELARFPVFEGKTWNHPVLVGDVLLARNDQEMAAFRLSLAGD